MTIGSRNEASWAWGGVALLVGALFAVLSQWGGTLWSAPALITGCYVIFILLLVSLAHFFTVKEASLVSLLFSPWVLYVFFSGVLVSVAPWDAWRSILCQLAGGLVFYITYAFVRTERAKWGLMLGVFIAGISCACIAYYQAYVDYDWGPFGVHRLEQYQNRMAGFFGQPNAYAAFVMLSMPIPIFYAFSGRKGWKVKMGAILLFLFLQWAVMLGVSRGALITLNLLFFLYAICLGSNWKQRITILGVMFAVFFVQFSLFSLTQSVVEKRAKSLIQGEGEITRKVFYPIAWEMFTQRSLLGYGEESFQYVWDTVEPVSLFGEEKNVHSDHLEVLAENGVVGGLLYYFPVGGLLLYSLLKLKGRQTGEMRAISGVAIVGMCGFLIHGSVDFLTKYLSLLFVSFIYLAFLAQEVKFERSLNSVMVKSVVGLSGGIAVIILFLGIGTVRAIALTSENWTALESLERRLGNRESVDFSEFDAIYVKAGKALEFDPGHVPAMLHAAKALSIKARYDLKNRDAYMDLALDINAEALNTFEGFWRAWIERVNLLTQYGGGHHEEVMECYSKALLIAPENLLLRMNYIVYLKSQGITGGLYQEQADFVRQTFPGHPALNDL